jgi:hypothetical protein
VFLPFIAKAPSTELIVAINEEPIAEQPVATGATFATRTAVVPASLPANVAFYLSSSSNTLKPARVDDRIILQVEGVEVFSYTYGLPPEQDAPDVARPNVVVEALARIPDAAMRCMAGEVVTAEFVDVYGRVSSASRIFIVAAPR